MLRMNRSIQAEGSLRAIDSKNSNDFQCFGAQMVPEFPIMK